MIHETLVISVPGGDATLTVYAPDNFQEIDSSRTRRAVVMCPGGAYRMCSDREAEPVALQMLAADVCVFVLRYSVQPVRYPVALTQAAAAVHYVRSHAEKYHIEPDKIAVMGYSAGGHLAASLGVRWQEPWLSEALSLTPADIRPNGMILCYPVITGTAHTHAGSLENLTGSPDPGDWKPHCLENLVTGQTPPAFLWHTYTDEAVPVENSLLFFTAMRRHGVPGELHIYPKGVHGLSLATAQSCDPVVCPDYVQPDVVNWVEMALRWLKQL